MKPQFKGPLLGIVTGLVYGLILRIFSGNNDVISTMSLAFMIGGPLAIGALTIRFINEPNISKTKAFFLPFIPVILGCLVTLAVRLEGTICVVMYLPLGFVLAGIGGLFMRVSSRNNKSALAFFILPFVIQPLENKFSFPTAGHVVANSIVIQGSAENIWNEIKSVKTITPNELSDSWVHKIGFPRPLDAEINFEGKDGIRTARFERGLVFIETVTDWLPNQTLSFRIDIDPENIPPNALDEHVTIGGPYFDVLQGTYKIEQNTDGTVTLYLESQFRLSTHFNFYAQTWTDLIMHQIQSDILSVIKKRAEKS